MTSQAVTPLGVAHCLARLSACHDLESLNRVWGGFGVAYQRHPRVLKFKEHMETELEAQK